MPQPPLTVLFVCGRRRQRRGETRTPVIQARPTFSTPAFERRQNFDHRNMSRRYGLCPASHSETCLGRSPQHAIVCPQSHKAKEIKAPPTKREKESDRMRRRTTALTSPTKRGPGTALTGQHVLLPDSFITLPARPGRPRSVCTSPVCTTPSSRPPAASAV